MGKFKNKHIASTQKSLKYISHTCADVDTLFESLMSRLESARDVYLVGDCTLDEYQEKIKEEVSATSESIKSKVTIPFREALVMAISDYSATIKDMEEQIADLEQERDTALNRTKELLEDLDEYKLRLENDHDA